MRTVACNYFSLVTTVVGVFETPAQVSWRRPWCSPSRQHRATMTGGGPEEIVVTASLRPELASHTRQHDDPRRGEVRPRLQHFGDVLGLVPNLNWSGGSSRPRYFQLRGIGELEQYQGAPNPSVGFLIDEVDFSGVGMPATCSTSSRSKCCASPGHVTARTRSRG